MSNLTQTELTKVRKAAIHSVTLSSEMKTSAVDSKLRNFTQEIKKLLLKNGVLVEVVVVSGKI
jgi:hypothetical protein